MKAYISSILASLVTAALVAFASYVLVIKENQILIKALQSEIAELKAVEKETQTSLVSTKLFIASAHPEKDISKLSSVKKLNKLSNTEIDQLAVAISETPETERKGGTTQDLPVLADEEEIRILRNKYNFTDEDMRAYRAIGAGSLYTVGSGSIWRSHSDGSTYEFAK